MQAHSNFITLPVMLAIAATFSILVMSTYSRKYLLAAILMCIILIPTAIVNPISRGVNVFEDTELSTLVSENTAGRWVVYGDSGYANLIKAYGADVFNGVKYIPDLEDMAILDPNSSYIDVYNRYAHISLDDEISAGAARFSLLYPDAYVIYLDPCGDQLVKLGIEYVLSSDPLDEQYTCLTSIFERNDGTVTLHAYELQFK